MRVLIVDDNSANRLTLSWILKRTENLQVEEAENGKDAIEMCKKKKFDIVFMDVMMPEMTGIEATRQIREFNKTSMIIAVTALDDEKTTREMFSVGAEDYITKPIQQDIFKARLATYLKVVEKRNFYEPSASSVNLYKKPVMTLLKLFKVTNEHALVDFWEHFAYGSVENKNEELCDVVAKIYHIGSLLLKMGIYFSIFCEENETSQYFTLNKTNIFNKAVVDDIITKNSSGLQYKVGVDRITFAVNKARVESDNSIDDHVLQEATVQRHVEPAYLHSDNSKLQVFNFIDEDEFMDLDEYIKELDSILVLLQNSKIQVDDIDGISYKIKKLASILSSYTETYSIGVTLTSLSLDITENKEAFISNRSILSTLFLSFTRDILDWHNKLFRTGAPSIGFMDATIMANSVMISSIIKHKVEEDPMKLDVLFFG